MRKIALFLCVLTICSLFAGCSQATKIGNPYVPKTFTINGVTYDMEEDNIPQKLNDNGWSFTPDGKTVTAYYETEVPVGKTRTEIIRQEFVMTLKRNASTYESVAEYDVESITFHKDKISCDFTVQGVDFDEIYQDTKMKFGSNCKESVAEDNSPIYMVYTGKTRKMIVNFNNWRIDEFVFEM